MACRVCVEREKRINSILKSYRRDKKWAVIIICVLTATLIYGQENVMAIVDKIF